MGRQMKIMAISNLHYDKRVFKGIDKSRVWKWLLSIVNYHRPDYLLNCGNRGVDVNEAELYELLRKTSVLFTFTPQTLIINETPIFYNTMPIVYKGIGIGVYRMNLTIPPEPIELKNSIRETREQLRKTYSKDAIDSDQAAVWYLNRLPSYLWQKWKTELERNGYTWQKFLKVVKLHTIDVIEWAITGSMEWDKLVKRIIASLDRYRR